MLKRKVTAVIPALNEAKTIGDVIKGVMAYVDEVILVDDGSTDHTAAIAKEQGAIVVSKLKNQGYEKSLNDGFALAVEREAGVMLSFDGDGQHDSLDIPKIVEPILNGKADVVTGRRPYYPRVTEYFFSWLAQMKADISDPLCGLKAYDTKVYKDIGYFDRNRSIGSQFVFDAKKKGYTVVQRDITIKRRKDGSRFGKHFSANWKIFKAMIKTLMRRN